MSEPIAIPDETETFEFPNPDAVELRTIPDTSVSLDQDAPTVAFDAHGNEVPKILTVSVDVYEAANWIHHVYAEAKENLGDDFSDFAYLAMVGKMLAREYGFPKSLRPGQVKFVADKVFELAAKKNTTSANTLRALLS